MAKNKQENVEEVETEEVETEITAEDKPKKTAKSKKTEKKADASKEETTEDKADNSVVGDILDAAADVVSDVVEKVAETASDVVEAATDAVQSAVGGSDEDETKAVHKRAEKVGIVQSDKMTNTVTVRVDRVVKHPMYRKYVKRKKKFMAHDEMGATIGDKVRIVETRPLSARKRWRVVEIVQKAVK